MRLADAGLLSRVHSSPFRPFGRLRISPLFFKSEIRCQEGYSTSVPRALLRCNEKEKRHTAAGPLVLFHDGNISNRNQARALAHAIGFKHQTTTEINLGEVNHIPPEVSNSLVIGCGRRVAKTVSAYTGRGGNKTVQILHPRLFRSTAKFDCLVIPYHDRLSWLDDEAKIVRMHGALSWSLHASALKRFQSFDANPSAFKVCALIGGGLDNIERIAERLLHLRQTFNANVTIVCSRRTPLSVVRTLRACLSQIEIWHPSQGTRNPYRAQLANSDMFLVSEDSVSMIADVLTVLVERKMAGPIYLLGTRATTRAKHERFISEVEATHQEKVFHRIEDDVIWTSPNINRNPTTYGDWESETARVGRKVREFLLQMSDSNELPKG